MNLAAIIAILIMVLAFGIVMVFTLKKYFYAKKDAINRRRIKGVCIDFIERRVSLDWTLAMFPIVEYEVNGKKYEVTSQIGYKKSIFPLKNRKFDVLYNPINPQDAVLENYRKFYFIVACVFTLSFLYIGYFLINDLVLGNTIKCFTYQVNCTINGYSNTKEIDVEARTEEEALQKAKEKYNIKNGSCEYIIIQDNID